MSVLGNQVLIWSGALFNRTFITDLSWQSASRKGPYSLLYLPTKDAGSWSPSQTSPRNFRPPQIFAGFRQPSATKPGNPRTPLQWGKEGGEKGRERVSEQVQKLCTSVCVNLHTYFAKIPWVSIPVVQGGKDGQNPPWRPPFLVFSSLWFL